LRDIEVLCQQVEQWLCVVEVRDGECAREGEEEVQRDAECWWGGGVVAAIWRGPEEGAEEDAVLVVLES
jgi:hypothetical protein